MLPTNEKAGLYLVKGKCYIEYYPVKSINAGNQHLYILPYEEVVVMQPKEGNCWAINKNNDTLYFLDSMGVYDSWLKVIASTDPSLNLPSPSQSFIEEYVSEYNKGNIITDVLVEYKEGEDYLAGSVNDNECWDRYPDILKVSRDNTVTIKKVKDSWTRDEVIKLCKQAIIAGSFSSTFEFDEWIETNL